MGNLFDAALVIALVGITVLCFKMGFIKMLKPFRKLAAFVLAWSLKDTVIVQGTVGKAIKTDKFKAFLAERVDALWGESLRGAVNAEGVSIADRFDGLFGFWGRIFSSFKDFCISLYDKDYAHQTAGGEPLPSEQIEAFTKSVTEHIADTAAGFITALIGFIALYVIFSVGFWLGAKVLDTVFDAGVLGLLNRCLGGVVGICYGFLVAWLLSVVFVFLLPLVTSVNIGTVTGGFFGITEWFYTKFFLSALLGMTI